VLIDCIIEKDILPMLYIVESGIQHHNPSIFSYWKTILCSRHGKRKIDQL